MLIGQLMELLELAKRVPTSKLMDQGAHKAVLLATLSKLTLGHLSVLLQIQTQWLMAPLAYAIRCASLPHMEVGQVSYQAAPLLLLKTPKPVM